VAAQVLSGVDRAGAAVPKENEFVSDIMDDPTRIVEGFVSVAETSIASHWVGLTASKNDPTSWTIGRLSLTPNGA